MQTSSRWSKEARATLEKQQDRYPAAYHDRQRGQQCLKGPKPMEDELDIARKHGLFWANSEMSGDAAPGINGFYIYQPERFSNTFFVLFEKLRQLNDYCFHQLIASEGKLRELTGQRSQALERAGTLAQELDFLDDEIPLWQDNVTVISQAVPVVLLCSFVEWGLKRVIADFGGNVPRKTGRALSDIQFLLEHLEQQCGLPLGPAQGPIQVIHELRPVRNAFAHGQWQTVHTQLARISLREGFTAVSSLFQHIEEEAWMSPWATTGS